MDETSLSLLARVRQPTDSSSWERLVNLYAPLMRGWLRPYGVQDADAEDLIQDVLAVVAREISQFDHNQRPGAFRRWLRTLVVHRLRHFWRSNGNRQLAVGGTSVLEQLHQLEDETSRLSRIWNQQHDRDVIARLLELVRPTFLPKTWTAFHRQMFDGQSAEQVAAELGMALGSVYMARNRVLSALRREASGLVDSP
ncbi:MAG: sigma-70 family RNA polymerase sigma factor [Pirellulaceae bacterium]|nr:sigma-70 family RNA polymerase sigma factor [Pirellulaceae bacterium]